MAKPEAKTLQQKLGFSDDDLTSPGHDKIMMWLHKNMDQVVNELYGPSEHEREIRISWEVPIVNRGYKSVYTIGFADMLVEDIAAPYAQRAVRFHVEVKTKIKSLGELFRQLRLYQGYAGGDFVVVCPDDSNREIIEDQGFKFYKCEK